MDTFWDKYYEKPLNTIPWQNTQADWFKKLVDSGKITGDTALDLGCGTGKKSIYLAKACKFKKIIGIDISKQAVKYARANAKDSKVEKICSFICHDLRDWSFITQKDTFDFILDWAVIHSFTRKEIINYAKNINQHLKIGGKFLVRSFSGNDPDYKEREIIIDGIKSKVSVLQEDELKKFFPQFRILEKNTSLPHQDKAPGDYFIELLMQKK